MPLMSGLALLTGQTALAVSTLPHHTHPHTNTHSALEVSVFSSDNYYTRSPDAEEKGLSSSPAL